MYKMLAFFFLSCCSSFVVYTSSIINYNQLKDNKIVKEEQALMILEIPKINFKGKIYNKGSSLNNIDKNIIIMDESDMPDETGGILIIGGHSGYGKYAYFKNLNKLTIDDIIYVHYQGIVYSYKVVEYHLDQKDGSIAISNFNKKNKLFLYTCNPNDKNNYLIYVSERV